MIRVGDTVSDRYQVVEQLTSGGMGSLWRARHVELDVDVALKVISSNHGEPRSLERFRREAKAAARLRSPNIVQVLDYGIFDGHPFLVMELLRGEDLAACLVREGKLTAARCVRIVEGMAKAVQFAHDEGVIHRDLKPANIFLERVGGEEVVKILDFGVAKDLRMNVEEGNTSIGTLVGSPAYMSPEQVWSERIGYPSDVWAMGVVAFEMLTGKNPFADESLARMFERIVRGPLPKARALNADLPASIDGFFERAFARTVSERIPSAREFALQFQAAMDGLPAAASSGHAGADAHADAARDVAASQPLIKTEPPSARRDPETAIWRRSTAVAVGLVVVIAAIGAVMFGRRASPARDAAHDRAGIPGEVFAPRPAPAATAPAPAATAPAPAAIAPAPAAIAPAPLNPSAPLDPAPDAKRRRPKTAARSRVPAAPPAPTDAIDPRFGIRVGP